MSPDSADTRATADARQPAPTTFSVVADIIAEVCSVDRATILPDSHTIEDLGIDSLDFLDVTFAIDKRFGIKMPIERWLQEVNQGRASVDNYFILRNLCDRIDELVALKPAPVAG